MELSIILRSYELYKSVIMLNASLSRIDRYRIGISLEESIVKMLEEIITSKNTSKPFKSSHIQSACTAQEIVLLKLRLYLDLKLANSTQVFQVQSLAQEIGKMLGGWRKSMGE